MTNKKLVYDLEYDEIKSFVEGLDLPLYKADQIWQGLYKNLWDLPDEFSNLSKEIRNKLSEQFSFSHLKLISKLFSKDNQTEKALFQLPGGELVETVLMTYKKRQTLCISTQVGCAMGCVFCATGQMGFGKNLSNGEIVEQVLYFSRELKKLDQQVTNVVFMGMGEPFHNYDASLQAIDKLNHQDGFKLGARRFTISTVGLIPEIRRFTKEKRQINLAISLHSTNDEIRSSILPVNKKYPIKHLIEACKDYVEITGRRITFEWALIDNLNDSKEEAKNLSVLLSEINCHVNIIPLNPTKRYDGKRAKIERAREFRNTLLKNGISCTIRVRRGIDIQAGCGQLAGKYT